MATDHDLHQLLKSETHDAHMQMHEHPLLLPLQRADITMEKYNNILRAFYAFYQNYEDGFQDINPKYTHELKPIDLLQHDFSALSMQIPTDNQNASTLKSCFSEYLGYLYVKQGSTLGGQYISAQLKKNLGLVKGENLFFFNGYGSDTGKRWQEFLVYLNEMTDKIDENKVVSAARSVFNDMKQMFDQHYKAAGQKS